MPTLEEILRRTQKVINHYDNTKATLLVNNSHDRFVEGRTEGSLGSDEIVTRLYVPNNQADATNPQFKTIVDSFIALFHEHRHVIQKTKFFAQNDEKNQALAVYDMITQDIASLHAISNRSMYCRNPNEIDSELYGMIKAPPAMHEAYPAFSIEAIENEIINQVNKKIKCNHGEFFVPDQRPKIYTSFDEIISTEKQYLHDCFYLPIDIDIRSLTCFVDKASLGFEPKHLETMFDNETNGCIQGITLVDLICKISPDCIHDKDINYPGIKKDFLDHSLIHKYLNLLHEIEFNPSSNNEKGFTPSL